MKNKISVVVPHVPISEEFEKMLDNCLGSIRGEYDELILVINNGEGYGKSFNRGFKQATGDYIFAISNDTFLEQGTLGDMCDPNAVTFSSSHQWGCFFCLPRWVYEKIGGFDESFGLAYFEDDDYIMRLQDANIPILRVSNVVIDHVGGATVKGLDKETEASAFGREMFIKKWKGRMIKPL